MNSEGGQARSTKPYPR